MIIIKLWVDDVRPAPSGYYWCKSVNDAKRIIQRYSNYLDFDNNIINAVELVDIDHDAGDYAFDVGDIEFDNVED